MNEEELEDELRAEDAAVAATLNDYRDHSGRGAAHIGAELYDIVRDADGPITVAEIVDRWVDQASDAALGHVRRYAEHYRRRERKSASDRPIARGFALRDDARKALGDTLRWSIRSGHLRRIDGRTDSRGMWAALVEPGTPPRVYAADSDRRYVPYTDEERARRRQLAAADRIRARAAGIAGDFARANPLAVRHLEARILLELIQHESADLRSTGNKVAYWLRRYAPNGTPDELHALLDEIARHSRDLVSQ